MPSFSSLRSSLSTPESMFTRNSRHTTYNFNQDAQSLYRNQPRLPFEYYININLNNVGTAKTYISTFFDSPTWSQLLPLVKSVEMPSMKIETTPLNQYNRKRLSQTKIGFEPIKMVFHDVVDGKTLKFWEMYYRYYFADGNEAGQNINAASVNANSPTNTVGNKSGIQNIITNTLDNHNFGFNLPEVKNIRNLIQSIEIFQVHAGRFNRVTIVNPRISAFTHDVLNYAVTDRALELTFAIEYEYAYYSLQNMKLGGQEINNGSTIEQYQYGDFLETPSTGFNASMVDFIESNNPSMQSDNTIIQRMPPNIQAPISDVTNSFSSDIMTGMHTGSGVLDGIVKILPTPSINNVSGIIHSRPFASSALPTAETVNRYYTDIIRIGNNG